MRAMKATLILHSHSCRQTAKQHPPRTVLGVIPGAQRGKLGLEFLVHGDMHVPIQFDEQSKEEKRAFDALDQGKLLMVLLHDPDVAAAAEAISIRRKWGRA